MNKLLPTSAVIASLLFAGAFLWIADLASRVGHEEVRITKVESLCSTTIDCQRILDKLLKDLTPAQRKRLATIVAEGVTPLIPNSGHQQPGPVIPALPELPKVKLCLEVLVETCPVISTTLPSTNLTLPGSTFLGP